MIRAVFYFADNTVTIHSENTKHVEQKFKPGYYNSRISGDSLTIDCIEFNEIHEPFPNQKVGEVIDSVSKFLNADSMEACNEMGFVYKLNILLYGKQGVGKTALINYLCQGMIDNHDAIVFRVNNSHDLDSTWALGEQIRRIQPNPLIFIMDEFDHFCTKSTEPYIKSLLDGNRSINNSIVFAATNYMDKIPNTIKDRPSRFRVISEILPITDVSIIEDLIISLHKKATTPFLKEEGVRELAETLKGSTVDEIKTLIIDNLMRISLGLSNERQIGYSSKGKEEDGISPLDVHKLMKAIFKSPPKRNRNISIYNHEGEM